MKYLLLSAALALAATACTGAVEIEERQAAA